MKILTLLSAVALLLACRTNVNAEPAPSPSSPSRAVSVRVRNEATCPIRLAITQGGAPLRTVFVESLSSREATIQLRDVSTIAPLEFRVIGTGCQFADYMFSAQQSGPAAGESRIDVVIANLPSASAVMRRP